MKGILILCIFIIFALCLYLTIRKLDLFMDQVSDEKARLNDKVYFAVNKGASANSGNHPLPKDIA